MTDGGSSLSFLKRKIKNENTMLKITIECEGTGADLRQELLNLFAGNQPVERQLVIDTSFKVPEPVEVESQVIKLPQENLTIAQEETKKKRRTKAEIESEAVAFQTDLTLDAKPEETRDYTEDTTKPVETTKFTLEDAKLAAAKLSRAGYRDEAKAIAYKYASMTNPDIDKDASLVPKIAPEHFEAFIAEIEAANK